MKGTKVFAAAFAMMLLMSVWMASTGAAAKIEGQSFDLISVDSGYKLIVPGFVDLKQVSFKNKDGNLQTETVVVMKTPKKDSAGRYPIFQILTTDPSARSVEAYPGTYQDGQLGQFSGVFANGELMFSPTFSVDSLQKLGRDRVFTFDFTAYDEHLNPVFWVYDLNFMFVDEDVPGTSPLKPTTAQPTSSKVEVDGKVVAFEAYHIDGFNYFKLRDLAMAVNGTNGQFEVSWDDVNKAINLLSGTAYTSDGSELVVSGNAAAQQATPTTSKIYIDHEEVQLTAYNIGGYNYFKLRDIAQAIDFNVTWNAATNTVGIDTANGYVVP